MCVMPGEPRAEAEPRAAPSGAGDRGEAILQRAGAAVFPSFRLLRLARTGSTQDVVRAAARAGAAEGFCCVAEEQVTGRGRDGRRWVAPPGTALLVSLLLRRSAAVNLGVPFAAGLALLGALRRTCGVAAQLKWPNDVMVGGGKLAGILAEGGAGVGTVLGLGVNLTVPSFPADVEAVSLHRLTAAPPPWWELLASLLEELGDRLSRLEGSGVAGLREEWLAHAYGIGEPVRADSGGRVVTGIATGLDSDGALLLDTASGPLRVVAGDVHLLRSP
jgi:BirA family biotin operon repressor/biotin-[acetyl-CoA-carboxylase] ligase